MPTEVTVLTNKSLLVTFEAQVVVNNLYKDPASYSVVNTLTDAPTAVRSVLVPNKTLTTSNVVLVLDSLTEGETYTFSATSLLSRSGASVSDSVYFTSRNTKTAKLLAALPEHFDKRPSSTITSILTAMGIEDDRIGGEEDLSPTLTSNVLLTEDGESLLTEAGSEIVLEGI